MPQGLAIQVPKLFPGFEQERIQPPAPLVVTKDDQFALVIMNSVAGAIIVLRYRMVLPDGRMIISEEVITPASDRSQVQLNVRLPDGFLLNLSILTAGTFTRRGQCFAQLALRRVTGSLRAAISYLVQGYATNTNELTWPYGPSENAVVDTGILRSIAGTDPAAGVEISETVPTGARWRLHGLVVPLVTNATAANRLVQVVVDDGTTIFNRFPAVAVQAASLTVQYSAAALGAASVAAGADNIILLPTPLDLLQGWRVRTVTTNLQAGDNFGAPQLRVEEWIEL